MKRLGTFCVGGMVFLLSLGFVEGADVFTKGTDAAPATAEQPFVGPNGSEGGMPVAARQVSQGPNGGHYVLGTEAAPVTLPQLLDEALRRNPATRQGWELTRAAVANVGVAKSGYYPTVTLQATGNPSHQTNPNYEGGGNIDQIAYGPALQIQYLLLDFGARAAGVEAARFNLLAQDYAQNSTLQSVLFQVEKSYYALDGARAQVVNSESALKLAQSSMDAAKARFDAGLGTRTAYDQATQTLAQAKYNLADAKGNVRTAEVNLAQSLGLPANAELHVAPPRQAPPASLLSDSVDRLIDQALRQRPDLAAKYATYKQATATAKQASANQGPQLTLGATLGQSYYHTTITGEPASIPGTLGGNGTYNGHTDEASALLTFSIDLFDGALKLNQARQARHQAAAAQADLNQTELAVIADVVANFVAFQSALEEYRAGEELVHSSETSYTSTSMSYRSGLVSILDTLTAESNLASARATLTNARTTVFTTSAQLANSTGALLPRDLHAAAVNPSASSEQSPQ